jgi:nitric oxide reductase activation protein
MLHPTEELIAMLPEIAARQWASRNERIGKDAEMLSKRLIEQRTLNQKLIAAKLNGEITAEDFQTMKASIAKETERINTQIATLDSEKNTLQDLMQQAQAQLIDFVGAWRKGSLNQRQELALGLFPEGLAYSHKNKFFEPQNTELT